MVLGQADYAAIAPPHSFINAGNFTEPKQLALYLKQVMNNETEYLSYIWWKQFYEVNSNSWDQETKINGNKRKIVLPSFLLQTLSNA